MTRLLAQVGPHSIAATLPSRAALHPARKAFHFLTGVVWAIMHENMGHYTFRFFVVTFFLISFSAEVTRIANPAGKVNRVILSAFRPFMRSSETHEYSGMMYYVFGIMISTFLFSRTCTTIAILCLATVDPVAALTGSAVQEYFPIPRLRNGKSVAGFVFGNFAGMVIIYRVLTQAYPNRLLWNNLAAIAILVATSGALVELLVWTPRYVLGTKKYPIGIDDNALIPIVSAAVCEFLMTVIYKKVHLAPLLFVRMS